MFVHAGLHAMGPIVPSQLAPLVRSPLRRMGGRLFLIGLCFVSMSPVGIFAQTSSKAVAVSNETAPTSVAGLHAARTRRFLGGRTVVGSLSAAKAMDVARK